MTDELKNEIESYRGEISKISCIILNQIRREQLDGKFSDSCFCTHYHRKAFIENFFSFYDSIEK